MLCKYFKLACIHHVYSIPIISQNLLASTIDLAYLLNYVSCFSSFCAQAIVVTSPTSLKPLCLIFVMIGVLFIGLFKMFVLVADDVRSGAT